MGFVRPVGERSSHRSREDVRRPKGRDRAKAQSPVGEGGDADQGREEKAGAEVPQPERGGEEIARGGTQGEGGQHRGPVEEFAARRVDGVNGQGVLGAVPHDKDAGENDGEEHARHGVGHVELNVERVGAHRAKDRHRHDGEPVSPGHVGRRRELHGEREKKEDRAETDGHEGVDAIDEVVRRRFAHCRGQEFENPEIGGNLGNLDTSGDDALVLRGAHDSTPRMKALYRGDVSGLMARVIMAPTSVS